ncbi:PAP2 superfamily protein [Paenibacillus cellulosilyticus]|uniref:PAP2 superfamily protein n=1 Tax=Paenibacillus cellulosilyticus TaxID=375489 RepID=A0A2V2YJ29_9BACL|nr:phosphatase PAP2 family protein [Paenibacillus cellulosilyticus]PWV91984.1 PAP2 superfamily protein [Paenibacillus cellulosilyticus]QKS46658.1 phosphatase PAP2 family protein [Paenibacillus cellulosilyticus]
MVLFDNMGSVAIYTTIVVTALLTYGVAGNPFAVALDFLKNLVLSPRYFIHFIALLAILYLNKSEMRIERNMDYTVNFTHWFKSIEGSFVANLQHTFENSALTTGLVFLYVVGLQALIIASIGVYSYRSKSKEMYYATCYAIMLNYLIAIPFFLFFPINEVWSFDPNVRFLMLEAFPKFETEYRPLSGLNNCFPSLHTSILTTLAILSVKSGNKKWAVLVCTCAVLTIFSIFYLGIHWLIDMCGGLMLATFASVVGIKLAKVNVLRLPDTLPSRLFAREEVK